MILKGYNIFCCDFNVDLVCACICVRVHQVSKIQPCSLILLHIPPGSGLVSHSVYNVHNVFFGSFGGQVGVGGSPH